jgi:hypothetical protein
MLSFVLWPLIGSAMSLMASALGVPVGELYRFALLR